MNDPPTGLRARRIAAAISQADLAKAAGVTQQMISQIELGLCIGKPATLEALAEALTAFGIKTKWYELVI